MTPQKPVLVGPLDLWVMLLSTFRYSFGRRSYITSSCYFLLEDYGRVLLEQQLLQIAEEIEKELEMYHQRGKTMGDKCDEEQWEKTRELALRMAEEKEE